MLTLLKEVYNAFMSYSVHFKKGLFMGKASSTYRVIEILKALNEGKILSIDTLASAYDTSARSIRRDFELIKEIFGDILAISAQRYKTRHEI